MSAQARRRVKKQSHKLSFCWKKVRKARREKREVGKWSRVNNKKKELVVEEVVSRRRALGWARNAKKTVFLRNKRNFT